MALMLREEAPEAFNYFTATPLKYYTVHEKVDVESWGVVFSLCPMTGQLRQARRPRARRVLGSFFFGRLSFAFCLLYFVFFYFSISLRFTHTRARALAL